MAKKTRIRETYLSATTFALMVLGAWMYFKN